MQGDIKNDMRSMKDHVNNDLRKAIRVFGDQLHALATKRTEEMSRLNDMLHKVQIELAAKKELRDKDSEHWQGEKELFAKKELRDKDSEHWQGAGRKRNSGVRTARTGRMRENGGNEHWQGEGER
jgi:hypothetical protein